MCFIMRTIAFLYLIFFFFDEVDFRECHCKEIMFLLSLSVQFKIGAIGLPPQVSVQFGLEFESFLPTYINKEIYRIYDSHIIG